MANEPNLASMSKVLDLIAVEVAKTGQAMKAGFERIEQRFEGVDRRLGRLESRVEDVEVEVKAARIDIADLNRRTR